MVSPTSTSLSHSHLKQSRLDLLHRITMSSQNPHVQFNPENRVFWSSHTGLSSLEDLELDAAYRKAYKFLTERTKKLINEHKWKEIDLGNRQILLSLSEDGYIDRFSLPGSFSSFLKPTEFADWRMQFETGAFTVKIPSPSSNDLFISGPTALSDIFYILQSIAPGMLLLAGRMGESDDTGELEWIRGLPRAAWIEENSQMLKYILGSASAYQSLLDASRDQGKSFNVSWINQWEDSDSDCRSTGSRIVDDDWDDSEYEWPKKSQAKSYAVCGSECGGCSRCDY